MITGPIATLGGGCFWCTEAALLQLQGVIGITSGYMGGHVEAPTYHDICEGTTGHAEVVRVEFDPAQLAYRDLLLAFFTIHDPTTLNRQGHDVGSQYRSVIFTHDDEQMHTATALIAELSRQNLWDKPIVTQLCAVSQQLTFWPAEDYHQNYFARNRSQPYCQAVVAPKVAKLRHKFFGRLRTAD